MNERIKELVIEADIMGPTWNQVPLGYQRFAELIIEEACQAFWSNACNVSDLAYEEYRQNSKKIKQHFKMPI